MVSIGPIRASIHTDRQATLSDQQVLMTHSVDTLNLRGQKETFRKCISRWFCFVPNLIFSLISKVIKDVIYVLSCCMLCKEHYNIEEVRKSLCSVADVWNSADATDEEKRAIFEDFLVKFPGQRERMIQELINVYRNAELEACNDPAEINQWDEANSQSIREDTGRRLNNFDAGLINSYLEYIQQ